MANNGLKPLRSKRVCGMATTLAIVCLSIFACKPLAVPGNVDQNRSPQQNANNTNRNQSDAQSRPGATCAKLVGGELTREHAYVSLVMAKLDDGFSTCTGTWVSDNTMITASHCVWNTESGDAVYIPGTGDVLTVKSSTVAFERGIKSIKAIIGSPIKTIGGINTDKKMLEGIRDIAVLIFPPNTAPAYTSLLERSINPNDQLTLVGYGDIKTPVKNAPAKTSIDARRRKGSNRLAQIDPALKSQFGEDYYIVAGDSVSDGVTDNDKAIVGHGDSGGPMLVGDTLGGVAVLTLTTPDDLKKYVNGATGVGFHASLQSSFAQDLLKKAEAAGAKVTRTASPENAVIYYADGIDPNDANRQDKNKSPSKYIAIASDC